MRANLSRIGLGIALLPTIVSPLSAAVCVAPRVVTPCPP